MTDRDARVADITGALERLGNLRQSDPAGRSFGAAIESAEITGKATLLIAGVVEESAETIRKAVDEFKVTADRTSTALVLWTKVLAITTGALVLATLVLVGVTWMKGTP